MCMMRRTRFFGMVLVLLFSLVPFAQAAGAADTHISNWAVEEVEKAERLGLLAPIVDGTLAEKLGTDYSANMTREQFVGLVAGLVESAKGPIWNLDSPDEDPFRDTSSYAVQNVCELGVINGTGNGNFSPSLPITREEIATILYRTIRVIDGSALPAPSDLNGIVDAGQVSGWALEAVRGMVGCGVMQGSPDGRLAPQGHTSIEQAILLAYRAFGQAIAPQAQRLSNLYAGAQQEAHALGGSRVDSVRLTDVYREGQTALVLYSLQFSLKADKPELVAALDGTLTDGWFTPSQPTILVLQRGAGGKFICQGGFPAQTTAEDGEQLRADVKLFLEKGTAYPYQYPQMGGITNTTAAYEQGTYQVTPTHNMPLEEIIRELTRQVLDRVAARDDMTYRMLDYHITGIYDIQLVEDGGESYWTAWPAFEMKYSGWYGLIGPSDGAWFISRFDTDGGLSRVRIDEKNGTYTLRCWAP